MPPDPSLVASLPTATEDDLALMRSSFYRAGLDAEYSAIEAEIQRRSTTLRADIERIELEQLADDCDGPMSGEFADALARVREGLGAAFGVTP